MSVIIETSIGDVTVDLYTDERPRCCMNFLKLCKIKYYNFSLFHTVQQNLVAQTGDPTATGRGGESVFARLYGEQARFFDMEVSPRIKHTKPGLISMVNNGSGMHGSQFFFTLADNLDYLDGKHTVFGEVAEGFDVLKKLNNTLCGEDDRPYQDIRIYHTIILDDPYDDPDGLSVPAQSPGPTEEMLNSDHIACDADIDEDKDKTEEQLAEIMAEKEAKANTQILEMVGDLPSADVAPPENVLFVCKLNPVTTSEDLEIIFSRFGPVVNCDVIKDSKTGESLQYAFIEFENAEHCESAYFKMDNVLIDDRRIHVDFSQSVSKLKWKGKGKGVEMSSNSPVYVLKNQHRQNEQYDLVYEHTDPSSDGRMAKHSKKHQNNDTSYQKKRDFDSPVHRKTNKPSKSRTTHSHEVRRSSDDSETRSYREDRSQRNSDHREKDGRRGTEADKSYSDKRRTRPEGGGREPGKRSHTTGDTGYRKRSDYHEESDTSEENRRNNHATSRYSDSSDSDRPKEKKKKRSKHKKHRHSSD